MTGEGSPTRTLWVSEDTPDNFEVTDVTVGVIWDTGMLLSPVPTNGKISGVDPRLTGGVEL